MAARRSCVGTRTVFHRGHAAALLWGISTLPMRCYSAMLQAHSSITPWAWKPSWSFVSIPSPAKTVSPVANASRSYASTTSKTISRRRGRSPQNPARPKRAAPYAARALALVRESKTQSSLRQSTARALLFPVISAWLDGELELALEESQRLKEQLPEWPRSVQDLIAEDLGAVALALGRVAEAETFFDMVSDPARRYELHALTLFANGDAEGLHRHLGAGLEFKDPQTAHLLAMAGHPAKAQALHDQLKPAALSDAQAGVIRGSLALGKGELGDARNELSSVVDNLTAKDRGYYFFGPDLLAATLRAEGKPQEAVRVLESTTMRLGQAAYHGTGLFWVMCQHTLAQLYREIGRDKDADQLESTLRDALRFADEEFRLQIETAPIV